MYTPSTGNAAGSLVPSVTIGASTTAASSTLPGNTSGNNYKLQIQISNTTTAFAYVNFGQSTSSVVAATVAASYPVAPGTVIVTVASEVCAASVILGTGTGNVVFTRGEGL